MQRQTPSTETRLKGKGQGLRKTGVNEFLIKIAESEGLRVVQECTTKERSKQYAVLYLCYSVE